MSRRSVASCATSGGTARNTKAGTAMERREGRMRPPTGTLREADPKSDASRSVYAVARPRRYGMTVNVFPPGPAWFDHGPQPASEPGAQVAPAGQARAMAL